MNPVTHPHLGLSTYEVEARQLERTAAEVNNLVNRETLTVLQGKSVEVREAASAAVEGLEKVESDLRAAARALRRKVTEVHLKSLRERDAKREREPEPDYSASAAAPPKKKSRGDEKFRGATPRGEKVSAKQLSSPVDPDELNAGLTAAKEVIDSEAAKEVIDLVSVQGETHQEVSSRPDDQCWTPTAPAVFDPEVPATPAYYPGTPSPSDGDEHNQPDTPFAHMVPEYSDTSSHVSVPPGFSPNSPPYSPPYSTTSSGEPNHFGSPKPLGGVYEHNLHPSYRPEDPGYVPTSPGYSPTTPSFSPTAPSYSPTSPL